MKYDSTRSTFAVIVIVVLLMVSPGGSARADYLYGVSEISNAVYALDPSTGQIVSQTPITGTLGGYRNMVPDGIGGLLVSADYGGPGVPVGDVQLVRLNPTTGATSLVGTFTDGKGYDYWVEGLTWINGSLYGSAAAIQLTSPPTYLGYAPDASNLFVKIDPATGFVTVIGAFGPQYLNMQALAYSPKFGLIGSDIGTLNPDPSQQNGAFSSFHTTPALVRIDPTTGLATKIADMPTGPLISNPYNKFLSPGGPFVSALTFSPDGSTLYGGTIQTHFGGTTANIVTVNPTSGSQTLLATDNIPVLLGLSFTTSPIPEPSSVILLALGLPASWLLKLGLPRDEHKLRI